MWMARAWTALWAAAGLAQVAPPTIVAAGPGEYALTCETPGAVIRYTLGGADPGKDAGEYLAPIRVPEGRVLKARAFLGDGRSQSALVTMAGDDAVMKGWAETLVPVTQNRDWRSYDWTKRHAAVVNAVKASRPEIVFVGDSITHFFGGSPADAVQRGPAIWEQYYGKRKVINLGYGWDRTENVLWRLQHGELDGAAGAKVAVVMIGTNNTGMHSVEDIAAGVAAICAELRGRLPGAKILLLGIFPRGQKPDSNRTKIAAINERLAAISGVTYLDIGKAFLEPDGTIRPEVMNDYLHPTAEGYRRWAEAMEPTLQQLLGEGTR